MKALYRLKLTDLGLRKICRGIVCFELPPTQQFRNMAYAVKRKSNTRRVHSKSSKRDVLVAGVGM